MLIPEPWVVIVGYIPWMLTLIVMLTKKKPVKKWIRNLIIGICIISFSLLLVIYNNVEGHPSGTVYSLIYILLATSIVSVWYIAIFLDSTLNTFMEILIFILAFLLSIMMCRFEWRNTYLFEYGKNVVNIEETDTNTYNINSENNILVLNSETGVEVIIQEGLEEPYLRESIKYYYEEDRNVEPATRKLANTVYEYKLYLDEEMVSNMIMVDNKRTISEESGG